MPAAICGNTTCTGRLHRPAAEPGYKSGGVGRLVTVDTDGQEIAALDVNEEILSISAAGRYLAVLYMDSVVIYTEELEIYAQLEGTDYARSVLMRQDGSALLLAAESAHLFLP